LRLTNNSIKNAWNWLDIRVSSKFLLPLSSINYHFFSNVGLCDRNLLNTAYIPASVTIEIDCRCHKKQIEFKYLYIDKVPFLLSCFRKCLCSNAIFLSICRVAKTNLLFRIVISSKSKKHIKLINFWHEFSFTHTYLRSSFKLPS